MIKSVVFSMIFLFLFFSSPADDGMWMPHQMKGLNLEKEGLEMYPDDLYKKDGTGIMSAVVYLGGGTGSFVSPGGLILTNHHVAFGAIQRASDRDNDYIRNGFLAESREKEIPAIGYIADVLLEYEEVTDYFKKGLRGIRDPEKRYKMTEKLEKRLISEKEREAEDRRCVVRSMYSGNQYYLFRFKRLRDIRLVYAPPRAIGNFGGDIDNWMWPRHTGDFTYLRAYVSKDNTGVKYNPENVPYQPKSHLKTSIRGLKKGDFTFVMGYPGRTYRNMTVSELEADMDKLKEAIRFRKDLIRFLEKVWAGDREIQIRYASAHKGLNNGLKNYTGKLEGFEENGIVELKKNFENTLLQWAENNSMGKKLKSSFDQLEEVLAEKEKLEKRSRLLNMLTGWYGNAMLRHATYIYRAVSEREKPDVEREHGFQERDYPRLRVRLEHAERSYHTETDKKLLIHLLNKIKKADGELWPVSLRDLFSGGNIAAFSEGLYSATSMTRKGDRLRMFDMNLHNLTGMKDPVIQLAAELEKEVKSIRDQMKVVNQKKKDIKKVYLKALMEYRDGRLAPDANSSIRFTYGNVAGYSPRDAVYYKPFTTLKGVMEKETGTDPFIVPERLKKLWQRKSFGKYADPEKKDVVACFLNTTNVTGGNSGSPVLNSMGEQVGIVFDMTYESVTGDYYVIPDLQRTIHVDIRYVLFVTEFVAGAEYLIREMGH